VLRIGTLTGPDFLQGNESLAYVDIDECTTSMIVHMDWNVAV